MESGSEACIQLPPEDRARLEGWVAGRNTPQKLVWRARIVLMWAQGAGVAATVRAIGKTKRTAYRWRDRYLYKFLLDLTDGVGWPFEVMARLIARPR